MKDSKILPFCHKHGIKLPPAWRHCCQAVRYHNKDETEQHFIVKAFVAHALMKRGQTVFTEFEFTKRMKKDKLLHYPVCDLFWLDELMVLEFETNWTFKKYSLKKKQFEDFNLFVFDLQKTSVDEILERIGVV